ncbi:MULTISPECIES: LytR/AlgR family response regulator transcription factor [Sphingobacterium]|jgi:DNA-binding LytR/AlgR family response regulator|uniref:Sensory transduction protein lytR n=1 Tax=Sphingobacterium multivorum TaxID=28454 RepID=A0A2X2JJ93_SPHMU|nr:MULTISPECIES: response regulator [Sphingobacterium]OJZ07170.1 MAG: two-component system response regulator [Sphingobacterium sp. 40-24]QQT46337.1 response regulator transcription factor [Sphingobacterium multivorum]QQT61120.1 response regulator transcription factor [Sphingobacterium multivorum]QRQ62844.1 response regulator transcription factor [Sphingobacterium multivorum]SPZ94352.1 Sensory transduction protein lytR [Sphingobacterium multivorum]
MPIEKNLKCILLDDEIPSLRFLKMLCEQIPGLEVVKTFNDPTVLLSEYRKLSFDFCILDIEMPEFNGFDLAIELKDFPIVFSTAYKQYASEAFDINAVDYMRKPLSLERLQQAIMKVEQLISKRSETVSFAQFNTNKGKTVLYFEQINYVQIAEVDSRDKTVYLADGSFILLKNISFDKLMEILPEQDFIRINKKEIIAAKIVKFFSADEITSTLLDEQNLPLVFNLGESYKKMFFEKFS